MRVTPQSKHTWDSPPRNPTFQIQDMFCSRGLSNWDLPPIQQSAYKACIYFIFFQTAFSEWHTFPDMLPLIMLKKNKLARGHCSNSRDVNTGEYQIKHPRDTRKMKFFPIKKKTSSVPSPFTPTPLINKGYKLFTCKQLEKERLQLQATGEDSSGSTGHEKRGKGGAALPLHTQAERTWSSYSWTLQGLLHPSPI